MSLHPLFVALLLSWSFTSAAQTVNEEPEAGAEAHPAVLGPEGSPTQDAGDDVVRPAPEVGEGAGVAVAPASDRPVSSLDADSLAPEEEALDPSEQAGLAAGVDVSVRSDRPGGTLHFDSAGAGHECRVPCTTRLPENTYRVTWVPPGGSPELLNESLRIDGAHDLRVAYTGPSFVNRLGYWLLGNGLLVGLPVSLGVFVNRDDIGAAATFSIIGVNTLVAIVGAVLMGVGDDEVVELSR